MFGIAELRDGRSVNTPPVANFSSWASGRTAFLLGTALVFFYRPDSLSFPDFSNSSNLQWSTCIELFYAPFQQSWYSIFMINNRCPVIMEMSHHDSRRQKHVLNGIRSIVACI